MKNLPTPKLTKYQSRVFSKICNIYGKLQLIEVVIRHDDRCGNGRNSFIITGDVHVNSNPSPRQRLNSVSSGCIHEEISEFFPELRKYIKWHLCSTDGPLHYIANTTYHAARGNIVPARSSAIWPNATIEQLRDKEQLLFRLPELMREFKQSVENLGFIY